MSFWRYFKGKLSGIAYIFLGVFLMAGGAWLISSFGMSAGKELGQLNIDSALCASGGLIIIIAGLVMAYGQRKMQKMDE